MLNAAVLRKRWRGECGCRSVLTVRARSNLVMSYDRPKFVKQRIDFWATCKIGRNNVEMALHGAVLCKKGRARRSRCATIEGRFALFLSRYEPKTLFDSLTFRAFCAGGSESLDVASRAHIAGKTLSDGDAARRGEVFAAYARSACCLPVVGVIFSSFAVGTGGRSC